MTVQTIHFHTFGDHSHVFSIDVPATSTVSDLCDLLARERSVPRSTVRIVSHGKMLEFSAPVSSITSSADDPVCFYAKQQQGSAPDQPKPAAPPSTSGPAATQTQDPRFAQSVASLVSLGFPRADCEKAFRLTGQVELAANLLLTGNITPEAARALTARQSENDSLYLAILGSPQYFQLLRSGTNVRVESSKPGQGPTSVSISPAQMNDYIMRTYHTTLANFRPDHHKLKEQAWAAGCFSGSEDTERALEKIWGVAYDRLSADDKSVIHGIVAEGFEFPVVLQVFLACEKNIGHARQALRALYAN
jgi:hypothetical protein